MTTNIGQAIGILCLALSVQSMKRSNTYIQKSNVDDLQSSGSGYSYQISSGDPFTYNEYKSDLTGKKSAIKQL